MVLGIGDWGLGIGDWAQSPIPKNKPISNSHFFTLLIIKLNYSYKKRIKSN
jgi:hypothetical protein